jgi:hypothetical protein
MEYEKFEKIILNLQKSFDQADILYNNGIDITEVADNLHIIINDLLGIIFTDDGKDWIDWFMYEKEFGKREDFKAWDGDNEIAYDIKSLYELLVNGYLTKK